MQIDIKKLIKSIAIPLAVGGIAAFFTREGTQAFGSVNQPPLTPPGWVFGVAWTILYTLMGISYYWVVTSEAETQKINRARIIYVLQLAVNFLWPFIFFNLGWYMFALRWLIILWLLVLVMIIRFYEVSPKAGLLQIPYLLWLTFAAYLNVGVWWLNRM